MMRDFKRHTARQIIRELQAREKEKSLSLLRQANIDARQVYKVWEDNSDGRDVFSPDFLQQKMDYIHWNPCQVQWKLAKNPEENPWSSARYYKAEQPAIIPIDDVRELFVSCSRRGLTPSRARGAMHSGKNAHPALRL
jgi:hypothetical protein